MRKRIVGETPLFLVWSLKQTCALKEEYDFDDLLMLERKLRPLQCLSEASAEGRIVDDTCIDRRADEDFKPIESVKGFSIDEITSAYGGVDFLKTCCQECKANACSFGQAPMKQDRQANNETLHRYAGCYGYLQSQYGGLELFNDWAAFLNGDPTLDAITSQTKDRISSLWLNKNLTPQAIDCFRALVESTRVQFLAEPSVRDSEDDLLAFNEVMNFRSALQVSIENEIGIQVQVIPAGVVDKKNWKVPQHCSVCSANAESWDGRCLNCQATQPPNSPLKRFIRGDRPYWPLIRFLGENGVKDLLARYRKQR